MGGLTKNNNRHGCVGARHERGFLTYCTGQSTDGTDRRHMASDDSQPTQVPTRARAVDRVKARRGSSVQEINSFGRYHDTDKHS